MKLEKIPQYELIKQERLEDIKSDGYLLHHRKSGARVLVLENDDENKVFDIAFRTTPDDSTGVAHILEHSVLCGSRLFPAKDPFVELVKGSLNIWTLFFIQIYIRRKRFSDRRAGAISLSRKQRN